MIFRSETHVFGQSSLFERVSVHCPLLCDSRFSRREGESRTRRRAAKSTREVSAHLSTDSAAARQRGSEREQNKKRRRQESTREVSAYTPILLFTSDVSCNKGLRFGWWWLVEWGRAVQASIFHTVIFDHDLSL